MKTVLSEKVLRPIFHLDKYIDHVQPSIFVALVEGLQSANAEAFKDLRPVQLAGDESLISWIRDQFGNWRRDLTQHCDKIVEQQIPSVIQHEVYTFIKRRFYAPKPKSGM